MQALPHDVNPFALLLDPQAVLAQIAHSERLERLQRRVCRPLDKPMLGGASEEGDEAAGAGTASVDNLADGQPAAPADEPGAA